MAIRERIIGFRLIDVSHSGQNIADRVLAVLEEYGLTAKTISVTLDNASSNTTALPKCHLNCLHMLVLCFCINVVLATLLILLLNPL
jgi:hypothetical protein